MTEGIIYPNAPIREAVLDIRVQPRAGLTQADLERVTTELKADYSQVQGVRQMMVEVGLIDPNTSTTKTLAGDVGFLAHSSILDSAGTSSSVYKIDPTGLSFSKLKPYRDWRDLKADAKKVWDIYEQIAQPTAITRLGLRYVNRIDIPTTDGKIDVADWFRTTLDVPDDFGGPLNHFFFQMQVPIAELGAECVINSGPVPPARTGIVAVMFDIDVFKDWTTVPLSEDMWSYFDRLRKWKNHFFEKSLTDRTKELFYGGN